MPSHKIHICVGEKIKEKYKFSDLFLLGCVIPDLCTTTHFKSHFKITHSDYDINKFINKYNLDNEILIGYLVHLLTDVYYNDYVINNYFLFDENQMLCGVKMKDKDYYCNPDEACDIKQTDFTNYDYYLLNNRLVPKLKNISLDNLPIVDECMYEVEYLKSYIEYHNNEVENKINNDIIFNIFTKEELDNLFNDCTNYISEFLTKYITL